MHDEACPWERIARDALAALEAASRAHRETAVAARRANSRAHDAEDELRERIAQLGAAEGQGHDNRDAGRIRRVV